MAEITYPQWWTRSPNEFIIYNNGVDPRVALFAYNPVPCDEEGHANELGVLKAIFSEEKEWKCSHERCSSTITQRVVNVSLQTFLHNYLESGARTTRLYHNYNAEQLKSLIQGKITAHISGSIKAAPPSGGLRDQSRAMHVEARQTGALITRNFYIKGVLIVLVLLVFEVVHYMLA